MIQNIFSMSSILESEQYIDNATNAFFTVLDEFAENGKSIDMGEYLQWYVAIFTADQSPY